MQVEWSPSGRQLVSLSNEGVYVWDVTSGELLTSINTEGIGTTSLSWSPDGLMLAGGGAVKGWELDLPVGSYEGDAAWIWDSRRDNVVTHFAVTYEAGNDPLLTSLEWSPIGIQLAAGGLDGAIHLWDVETTKDLGRAAPFIILENAYTVHSVKWNSDGTRLAVADTNGVAIFDVNADGLNTLDFQRLILNPVGVDEPEEAFEIDWHPDDKHLASVGIDNLIRVWDVASSQLLSTFGSRDTVKLSLDWNPDGKQLVAVGRENTLYGLSKVIIWDGMSGEALTTIPISDANYASWNIDGSQLAVGADNGVIHIWETKT